MSAILAGEVFSQDAISARVLELGAAIGADYASRHPVVLGVLNSCAVFVADLTRAIPIDCQFDFIAMDRTPGGVRVRTSPAIPLHGRHVIVTDDCSYTGATLRCVSDAVRAQAPASLRICTLIAPASPGVRVDYFAFHPPRGRLAGYGADAQGRYRERPALYALEECPT